MGMIYFEFRPDLDPFQYCELIEAGPQFTLDSNTKHCISTNYTISLLSQPCRVVAHIIDYQKLALLSNIETSLSASWKRMSFDAEFVLSPASSLTEVL